MSRFSPNDFHLLYAFTSVGLFYLGTRYLSYSCTVVSISSIKFTSCSFFFTFMWPCIVTNFFVIKPTRCTNFTNLFCHETLRVSDSSSVHHQEFIYYTLSNDAYMTYRFVDSFRVGTGCSIVVLLESCLQTCMTYTIAECTVNKLLMKDRRTAQNM